MVGPLLGARLERRFGPEEAERHHKEFRFLSTCSRRLWDGPKEQSDKT